MRAGLAVAAAVSATPVGSEPLHVRIGIATGLVVIGEPIGSGDSRQQTAVGETPNLAARLQSLAGPDQVVIDAATRRQIGGLFNRCDLVLTRSRMKRGSARRRSRGVAMPIASRRRAIRSATPQRSVSSMRASAVVTTPDRLPRSAGELLAIEADLSDHSIW